MVTLEENRNNLASRMRLLGLVKLASERTATSWPMHTFIYHNPLHDHEHLDFNAAVQKGKLQLGGEGYLSNTTYRNYFASGRILTTHLDAALQEIVSDNKATLADREVTHLEVIRAHFIHGFSAPAPEILESAVKNNVDSLAIKTLATMLEDSEASHKVKQQIADFAEDYHAGLGYCITLSACLDQIFGSGLGEKINQEMIKWVLPFLDEGQAPWPLPFREKGLYQSWKILAAKEWAESDIPNIRKKIERTPERPADSLLESLQALGIPEAAWEDYLGLHLSALPGWTALLRWRSEHRDYPWQEAYPVDLLQYLAIRLWYEREWLEKTAQKTMGIKGTLPAILDHMTKHVAGIFLRRERLANHLPASYAESVDQLSHVVSKSNTQSWKTLADQYATTSDLKQNRMASLSAAWRLVALSKGLNIPPRTLLKCQRNDLKQILSWIDRAPERSHGPIWLTAFETGFQETLLKKIGKNIGTSEVPQTYASQTERPKAQAIFCIDARSESFRRHLEKTGHYKTFGFAGFFSAFIRYSSFGSHHETDLFPAVAKAKNVVKEIPRPHQEKHIPRYQAGRTFMHAIHTLLHDLKENVITPYVMVESMGWFFGIPLIGKTLFPLTYKTCAQWIKKRLVPPLATTLTTDKATRKSVEKIIASEQSLIIREALRSEEKKHKKINAQEFSQTEFSQTIEALRTMAMERGTTRELLNETEQKQVALLFPDTEKLNIFIQKLRTEHFITEAWASARMEHITRVGFSANEQVLTIGTTLKVMGLTKNFAKLVFLCGHGSTSENNPYESALDCGACGGNAGNPNARVFAALANKTAVRKRLKKEGILIPDDTHFIAGEHDTTTDTVTLYDLEDLPASHKNDLDAFISDLKKTGEANSLERCTRFPDLTCELTPQDSAIEVIRRSATWSQTRPEWGLSGNAAIIISRSEVIQGMHLDGRVFLHSYLQEDDPTGQFLEIIMTGAQVVAQWINMGYYFSTTDNAVYGSGSKIYHNVAGRVGVMNGATGDLRIGLPWQTVGNGPMPYHEAMRLFVIIEAPTERIVRIVKQHRVLQEHLNNRWIHLVALDKGRFYRYLPNGTWQAEKTQT